MLLAPPVPLSSRTTSCGSSAGNASQDTDTNVGDFNSARAMRRHGADLLGVSSVTCFKRCLLINASTIDVAWSRRTSGTYDVVLFDDGVRVAGKNTVCQAPLDKGELVRRVLEDTIGVARASGVEKELCRSDLGQSVESPPKGSSDIAIDSNTDTKCILHRSKGMCLHIARVFSEVGRRSCRRSGFVFTVVMWSYTGIACVNRSPVLRESPHPRKA